MRLLLFLWSGPVARTCFDLPLHLQTAVKRACCMLRQDWKSTQYIFAFCPSVVKRLLMPDFYRLASEDEDICFLSGRYICSCQQCCQKKKKKAFDLMLIQLNSCVLLIRPHMIGWQVSLSNLITGCSDELLLYSFHVQHADICSSKWFNYWNVWAMIHFGCLPWSHAVSAS